MKRKPPAALESDGTDLFVVFNGVRIAKRAHPNTPQARTWIALEPGFTVLDNHDLNQITITQNGVRIQ